MRLPTLALVYCGEEEMGNEEEGGLEETMKSTRFVISEIIFKLKRLMNIDKSKYSLNLIQIQGDDVNYPLELSFSEQNKLVVIVMHSFLSTFLKSNYNYV